MSKEEVRLFEKYLEFTKTEKIEDDTEEDKFKEQFDFNRPAHSWLQSWVKDDIININLII